MASTVPSQCLFNAIDSLSEKLLHPVSVGTIPFKCVPISKTYVGQEPLMCNIQVLDICQYLGKSSKFPLISRLYLDPGVYKDPPAPDTSVAGNTCYEMLKSDLMCTASSAGSPLMCNGGGKHYRFFRCKLKNRIFRASQGKKKDAPRQDDCINQDKGGRRTGGRALSKRTRTTQALVKDDVCCFSFRVEWDSFGFFVNTNRTAGNPMHSNHVLDGLNQLTLPLNLLPQQEKDILRHMTDAAIGSAVGRNYVFSKLGRFITTAQLAYFTSEPTIALVDGLGPSDTDDMLTFFEQSKEISYHVLWDVPLKDSCGTLNGNALVSSLRTAGEEAVEIDHTSDPDLQVAREMADSTRRNPSVDPRARIFLAVAWASHSDLRLFQLFPEVFHADCTCDSNVTGNYLLTFSCRTSTGKQVVFLKIWIPNQKRFSFRWVFKFVLTSLIPKRLFLRTRFAMVDGDPQQRSELVSCMKEYMPNAIDGSCGWHVVNQGWKRHGPGKSLIKEGPKRATFDLFARHIRDWCYHWMRPGGAETEEEYYLSKELLFAFLSSRQALDACGGIQPMVDKAIDFVRNYVIVYEDLYVFHKKKHIRYFNVMTSSAHEGTNFGIKEHAAAVLPCHRISKAAKNLSLQSMMKCRQMEAESTYLTSSHCLWSDMPTSNHLTTLAESILSRNFSRIDEYKVMRTGADVWEVPYSAPNQEVAASGDRNAHKLKSPEPRFNRLRIVTNVNGSLLCDCCAQERVGLTCVRTMAVIKEYFPSWKGPTHHEQSPRWWTVWLQFGHKKDHEALTSAIEMLMSNEVKGPRFPGALPLCASYSTPTPPLDVRKRVQNYTEQKINLLIPLTFVSTQRTIRVADGLTQESFISELDIAFDQELNEDEDDTFNNCLDSDDNEIPTDYVNPRDLLKPQLNDLFQLMETLKSPEWNEKSVVLLDDFVKEMRLAISYTRKRNIESCLTVNANVEERSSGRKRNYASRNC
jgi:hypothetical protein